MRVVLGFDQGDRHVRLIIEDVVGTLGFPARDQLAADDNPPLGEADFLADLKDLVPPGVFQGGGDELGADIALGEASLVHACQPSLKACLRRNTHDRWMVVKSPCIPWSHSRAAAEKQQTGRPAPDLERGSRLNLTVS